MDLEQKFAKLCTRAKVRNDYRIVYSFLPKMVYQNVDLSKPEFRDVLLKYLEEKNPYTDKIEYYYIITKYLPCDETLLNILITKKLVNRDVIKLYIDFHKTNPNLGSRFISYFKEQKYSSTDLDHVIYHSQGASKNPIIPMLDIFLRDYPNLITVINHCKDRAVRNTIKSFVNDHYDIAFGNSEPALWPQYMKYVINNSNEAEQYIYEHFDKLENFYRGFEFFELKKIISKKSLLYSKIKEYMNNNFRDILEKMYSNLLNYTYASDAYAERQVVMDEIEKIFESVLENENASYSDVELAGLGSATETFAIKNKVVKLSWFRYQETIIDTPYIVRPVIRKKFSIHDVEKIYIEVAERVKPILKGQITEEELYELYKKMRDTGIVWVDVREDNVGRLLKDNLVYWKKSIDTSAEALNMIANPDDYIAKKGELVVLDNDHRFMEEEVPEAYYDFGWTDISYFQKFEKRYQKENVKKLVL